MYQALYRKWRPKTFDEVVGQPHVTETLKRQIETDRISHAYLFIGTRGTGKTTCAKILSKAVNCENPQGGNPCNTCPACLGIDSGSILDVEELDAASNNGVDHVRALREEAIFTPVAVKKRVYIIDEVHMLSTAAFNALLKILEEPPSHLIFILATTEAHKVPATILSRCQRYAFKRVGVTDITGRLKDVAGWESLDLLDEAAGLISRLADGSMRDALALLDQCAMGRTIDMELVQSVIGLAGSMKIVQLLQAIEGQRGEEALSILNDLYYSGKDMGSMLNDLSTLLRDILLTRIAPQNCENLLSGSFGRKILDGFSTLTPEFLLSALKQATDAVSDMARSLSKKLTAELCIIRLCDVRLGGDLDALQARVAQLEQQLESLVRDGGLILTENKHQESGPEPDMTDKEALPWEPDDGAELPGDIREIEDQGSIKSSTPVSEPLNNCDIWQKVLSWVQPKMDMSMYTLISDGKEVRTSLEGGILNIYIENDFYRGMAEQKSVLDLLKAGAEAALGNQVNIKIHSGTPPVKTGNSKLDALTKKGFENITIK